MPEGYQEIIGIALFSFLFCIFSGNSVVFSLVSLACSYTAISKKILEPGMILYLLYLFLNCHLLSSAESGWQERLAWVGMAFQGWHLGLNFSFERKLYSIIGKVVTLIWLNYLYSFDFLSPNLLAYMPIIVCKLYSKVVDKEEESLVLVTNSHVEGKCAGFSLPSILKFVPVGDSPPIISAFYQSSGDIYQYNQLRYKVLSIVNGCKIHLSITPFN